MPCLFVGAIVIVVSVAKVRNRMMEMKLEKVEEMVGEDRLPLAHVP